MEVQFSDLLNSLVAQFSLPLQHPLLVFSLLLVIVLMAPVIMRSLRIPSIIVLILSGLLVGPHGFGLVQQSSSIDLFSTIGLLYIMFIAGIDLDLNDFRVHRRKSIMFGILTFFVPMITGYVASVYVLHLPQEAGFLIACMFATHTLISYPVASRLGVVKNEAVAVTVGGTIMTNTAALILLAFLMGHHSGQVGWTFFLRMTCSALVLYLLIFILFPVILKYFFRHLESEKGSHFILVLAVMLLSAYFADLLGFEGVIGAFLAGLAVNRLVPASSALMNRIDFIGNTLFIPFFLISVGLMMDFSNVFSDSLIITSAIVLTIASVFGKWLAAFFTQIFSHFTGTQRKLMFGLSGSRAAVTLAIVLVGIRSGLMDDVLLNAAVIMILLTCTVSAIITEQSGRKLAQLERLQWESVATPATTVGSEKSASKVVDVVKQQKNGIQTSRAETILVPVAMQNDYERLLDFAVVLKDKRSAQPLVVGSVLPDENNAEKKIRAVRNRLEQYVRKASANETAVTVQTTLDYNISGGIVRLTREAMADVIVTGWPRELGLIDRLIGENAGGVVAKTDKLVFMCQIEKPLVVHHRIVLVVPALAELEKGFLQWLRKVVILNRELSAQVLLCTTEQTRLAFEDGLRHIRRRLRYDFLPFSNWDSFLLLRRSIAKDDLLLVVAARHGSVSYVRAMDQVPMTLSTHFRLNNKVVIYPQRYGA